MEQQIVVYKENGIELSIGDKISLKYSNVKETELTGFKNSELGKLMEKGVCDEIVLETKIREWLEVYFEVTFIRNGKPMTNDEYYILCHDCEAEDDNEIYTQFSDYMFLRYIIKKGGSKIV